MSNSYTLLSMVFLEFADYKKGDLYFLIKDFSFVF